MLHKHVLERMPNSFGLSKEHEQFYSLMRCPLCRQVPIVPKYFKPDGKQIPFTTPYTQMDRLTVAECPKCKQKWAVFSASQPGIVRQQTGTITVKADKPQPSQPLTFEISDLRILETEKVEEFLGSDQTLIDNSKSAINLSRKFTISKEWSQSYTIDYERTLTAGGEIGFGLLKLANIKLTAQGAIKDRYSITEGVKLSYSEEIVLQVPAYTKLRVFIQWKRIWQHGLIQFCDRSNREFEVPFRVATRITFDQTQVDEK